VTLQSYHNVSINETFTDLASFDTIDFMGSASQALRKVLETHEISQNRLAVVMGISRANVGRWFHGLDPSAENIAEITKALKQIKPEAAQDFVYLYLGEILDQPGEPQ
jgi:transcriptional regulator with XRE-family HTH domain